MTVFSKNLEDIGNFILIESFYFTKFDLIENKILKFNLTLLILYLVLSNLLFYIQKIVYNLLAI